VVYLNGKFQIEPPLQGIHLAYLDRFSRVRRMKRDVLLLEKLRDPLREAVGLPLGLDGAYYVAGEIYASNEHDNPTVIAVNEPPQEQPGLWCFWTPTGNGESYVWRGSEKYYDHSAWLEYMIAHFFNPWNYKLSGKVECDDYFCEYVSPNGDEDSDNEVEISYVDRSELIIKDNNIVIENDLGTFKDE
jgi:hypothetical protein